MIGSPRTPQSTVDIFRLVLGASALIAMSGLAARIVSLLASPILTRLLGPSSYGVFALASSVVSLGATLALFGRELGYSRYGAGDVADHRHVETYLWRGVIISSLLVGSIASLGWFIFGGPHFRTPWLASAIGLCISFSAASALSTVRARVQRRYRAIAATTALASLAGTVVALAWAHLFVADASALVAGLAASFLATVAALGAPHPTDLRGATHLSATRKQEIIQLGLSSVVTAPIYWMITSLDRWSLSHFFSAAEVGVYSFSAQFGILAGLANTAIINTWLIEANRAYQQDEDKALPRLGDTATLIITLLGVIWLAICAAGGDLVRLLATEPFHAGIVAIPWIAGGMFFYGVSWVFVASLFIRGRMRVMGFAWAASLIVALLSYATLPPILGLTGAAIGQALTFALIALITWFASVRLLPLPLRYTNLMLVSGIALVSAWFMQQQWHPSALESLLLKAPVGLALALLMLGVAIPTLPAMALSGLRRKRGA